MRLVIGETKKYKENYVSSKNPARQIVEFTNNIQSEVVFNFHDS